LDCVAFSDIRDAQQLDFHIWRRAESLPRISYAAISVIAAGLSCAHLFGRGWQNRNTVADGLSRNLHTARIHHRLYAFLGITITLVVGELVTALCAENCESLADSN